MDHSLLITGGCGFLGANLASRAVERGWQVVVFDNLSRLGADDNRRWLQRRHPELQFVHGDVRAFDDVERVVTARRPRAVFHLAGQVAMTTSLEAPLNDFQINAQGTLNVLECLRRHSPESALVYASTNKVYGDLEQHRYAETESRYVCLDRPHGFAEDEPLNFHSPYGCSKGAADQYCLDYHRMFGLKTVVLRHSSMYGGRQFATEDQGWIGWFCGEASAARACGRLSTTISGNGKQVRDILHADDAGSAYFAAIDAIESTAGSAFNIGGGMDNSLSLQELLAWLRDACSIEIDITRRPARDSDQRVFVANNAAFSAATGWQPTVGKAQGLAAMLDWSAALAVPPSCNGPESS
ncbi:MAG: NAD-dependent epimerase/dehydratase family protein [Planctomycetes bacterium]|nr:NAD-dependent epimerase/dehydratase family protein [Planctomycetota bacterium]